MLNHQGLSNPLPYFDRGGIKSGISHNIKQRRICYLHIKGDAGFGKTRLLSEIIKEIKGKPYIYCYKSPRESINTNGFIEDILKEILRKIPEDSFLKNIHESKQLKYKSIIQDIKVDGACSNIHSKPLIENFICDAIFYLSKRDKIFLFIEDVHWKDENRDSFLKKALFRLDAIENKNVCFITTSRKSSNYEKLSIADSVELHPFSLKDAEKLIRSCSLKNLSFREYGENLALFSQGNPYFISETINLLNQKTNFDNIEESLPRSFSDIFKSQVEELNNIEEQIMLASSIIGFTIKKEEIIALLPELTPYIDTALKGLVSKGHLIAPSDDLETFQFQHILKKEGFYKLIDAKNQKAWHYTLYKYYRSQSFKRIRNKFELCGYHAFHAEAYNEAPGYLWYCGKKALQLSEPEKAASLFSNFLECIAHSHYSHSKSSIRVSFERCRAFLMQGNVKLAKNSLIGVRSSIAKSDLSIEEKAHWKDEISTLEILLIWLGGSFDKHDLYSLQANFKGNKEADVTNQLRLSLMMIDIGEFNCAIEFFSDFLANTELRESYKNSGFIWSAEIISYAALANCYASLGDKNKVSEYIELTSQCLEKCAHPPQKMYGLTFGSKALHTIGEYEKAAPLIVEAYDIAQDYSVGIIKPVVWVQYAIHLTYDKQDYLGALSILDHCFDTTEFKGFSHAKAMIKKSMADVYVEMDMNTIALEILNEAETFARKCKNNYILDQILYLQRHLKS